MLISRELTHRVYILHRLYPACFLSSTDLKAHPKILLSRKMDFLRLLDGPDSARARSMS